MLAFSKKGTARKGPEPNLKGKEDKEMRKFYGATELRNIPQTRNAAPEKKRDDYLSYR